MKYISIFSGIEAATLAWKPLGWEPVAFAEIDDFSSAVLDYRWPDVPNLGDVKQIDWTEYRGTVDLVVGGTPCQSYSIAGNRDGLLDERGRLMFEYVRAVAEIRPRWIVWENVYGVLSQDRGRAFGTLLAELSELGYCLAWRVLDSRFTRTLSQDDNEAGRRYAHPVAQRRKRVFLVGHSGNGQNAAAAVLFERESLQEHH